MSWSKQVFSDVISEVGWDDDAQAMIVTFKNGATWAYEGTDESFADELSKAASPGGMFHSQIKGQMPGTRIR